MRGGHWSCKLSLQFWELSASTDQHVSLPVGPKTWLTAQMHVQKYSAAFLTQMQVAPFFAEPLASQLVLYCGTC